MLCTLAKADLRSAAHNRRLWQGLHDVQSRLAALGVHVAVAKGVTAEARWYAHPGERPCQDLDLLLEPGAVHRITEVVRTLEPAHFLLDRVDRLMRSGMLQSVDLTVNGIEVDLHVDILKFELPTRQSAVLWSRTQDVTSPTGNIVRALDAEMSLVHFLLHLNKDSFSRLLGYADVVRVLAARPLDWDFIDRFVAGEGLRVPVYSALDTVVEELALARPPIPRPTGATAALWRRLWPRSAALRAGRLGAATPIASFGFLGWRRDACWERQVGGCADASSRPPL